MKKYGTTNEIKMQITKKIKSLTEGYPKNFINQPNREIYKFLLGIERVIFPNKPIVIT